MFKPSIYKQSHTGQNKPSQGDWHVSHSSLGMGDYYGTGVKNPMGRVREGLGGPEVVKTSLNKPPKNLA